MGKEQGVPNPDRNKVRQVFVDEDTAPPPRSRFAYLGNGVGEAPARDSAPKTTAELLHLTYGDPNSSDFYDGTLAHTINEIVKQSQRSNKR
jgi:hypothetical protein